MLHCDSDFARASRRYFHQHPELSLQEYGTAKYIREKLTEFGIEYRTVGETGTYGWIRGKSDNGRKILLRADIDALPLEEQTDLPYKSVNPGVMHACGHDIHAAALLAAAKKLAEVREEFSVFRIPAGKPGCLCPCGGMAGRFSFGQGAPQREAGSGGRSRGHCRRFAYQLCSGFSSG